MEHSLKTTDLTYGSILVQLLLLIQIKKKYIFRPRLESEIIYKYL